jgi:hypothetical protein
MERRERGRRWGRWAVLTTAALAAGPAMARAEADASNVRLLNSRERFAVVQALHAAARRLGHPECQALLDEFKDVSGQPLRSALDGFGVTAPEYLGEVFFYDGSQRVCGSSALAVTEPRSRAVFVCGARFVRQMSRDSRHAEAALIHEALHSLGLGENPPSSNYITERVQARCGQR